eukprot:TRINITY_DN8380_c0_g1_i1.p2 TRINITY_DN8380_c0_g1~~TRINITY_DN8380_c0_g1_i1.p2  ORF type:complete len:177 (+),score=36.33 TRINITY_DN8380_c0_g1_i1:161-691(+)
MAFRHNAPLMWLHKMRPHRANWHRNHFNRSESELLGEKWSRQYGDQHADMSFQDTFAAFNSKFATGDPRMAWALSGVMAAGLIAFIVKQMLAVRPDLQGTLPMFLTPLSNGSAFSHHNWEPVNGQSSNDDPTRQNALRISPQMALLRSARCASAATKRREILAEVDSEIAAMRAIA